MKRIVVCLDGSPIAESILPTVGDLGRRTGAELVLLHVVRLPHDVPTLGRIEFDQLIAHQEREASAYLHRVAERLNAEGVVARTARVLGPAAPEIVRAAEHEQADAIALSTHGRSGLQRWLYGSVTDAVLHESTKPVLVLHPRVDDKPVEALRRITVALDGSAVAERALAPARDLARALAVPLVLLRVVDPMPTAFGTGAGDAMAFGSILTAMEKEADGYLRELATHERAGGIAVEVSRTTGAPSEMIAAYGEANPQDLLVLSTHGRTGWRATLLGSVARRVLLMSRGPLLMLPVPRSVAPPA